MYVGQKGFSIIDRLTRKQLDQMIEESSNIAEIFVKIGLPKTGFQYKKFLEKLILEGIDINLIKKNFHRKRVKRASKKNGMTTLELLSQSVVHWTGMKKRLIAEGYLQDKCYICSTGNTWNEKPLVLQVDHVDGNLSNNSLDNLRMLCPNCHTQTKTYSGRNKLKNNKKCFSCMEDKKLMTSGVCSDCNDKEIDVFIVKKFNSWENFVSELKILSNSDICSKYDIKNKTFKKAMNRVLSQDRIDKLIRYSERDNRFEVSPENQMKYTIDFLHNKNLNKEEIKSILEIDDFQYDEYVSFSFPLLNSSINNFSNKYLIYLYKLHKSFSGVSKEIGFSDVVVKNKLINRMFISQEKFKRNKEQKKCPNCDKIIIRDKKGNLRKFCNKICYVRNQNKMFENHKELIIQLLMDGSNISNIVAQLELPRSTVKGYIAKIKK